MKKGECELVMLVSKLNGMITELKDIIKQIDYPLDDEDFDTLMLTINKIGKEIQSINWDFTDRQWRGKAKILTYK